MDGHPGLEREIVPYRTDDGHNLNLHHLRRGSIAKDAQPVMLSHGAGVRAQLFYGQPVGTSLAERLLEEGYDVWVQNWRGSIDFPGLDYTHDRVARYDHPAAVETVLERSGASTLKAIIHCQGSINFTAAAASGLLPDVTHVVSSAVSLHIRVTPKSRVKQLAMFPVAGSFLAGADAQWGIRSPSIHANFFSGIAGLVRRDADCGNPVCATANYMYGAGPDVLLRHAEVDRDVHEWLGRELGYSHLRLHPAAHQERGGGRARAGRGAGRHADELRGRGAADRRPPSPSSPAPRTGCSCPTASGSASPTSPPTNPGRHRLKVFDGLGHLDTIIGKHSPEVFDFMLEGLER